MHPVTFYILNDIILVSVGTAQMRFICKESQLFSLWKTLGMQMFYFTKKKSHSDTNGRQWKTIATTIYSSLLHLFYDLRGVFLTGKNALLC
jgi:hypothetical protein